MAKRPGRPRTRPEPTAVEKTQKPLRTLRKAHKGGDQIVYELTNLMVNQLTELPMRLAEGDHQAAEYITQSIMRNHKLLAKRLAEIRKAMN